MRRKMKTAIMTDIMTTDIVDTDIPEIKEDEVLIKIEYVGVCGSDLHFYEEGHIGDVKVSYPFVLGHEAAGSIVKTGSAVENLKIGDRVALEPGKTCGKCEFCRKGKYNLCPNVEFFATPPYDGVFSEYAAHPAELCFKLPETVSTLEGALIEPLAVGFHAVNQGEAHIGQTAVVMGAGCIGLVSLLALKAVGITKVIVVDVLERRLQKAMELGAFAVVNGKDKNVVEEIMNMTGHAGCDLVIETAGTEVTTTQAIQMAKKGSNIVLVGYSSTGRMTLPTSLALDKELCFKTVFRYRHIYPSAIEAVADGRVNIKEIVTHQFKMKDIQKGLDECVNHKAEVVKAVIKI